LYFLPRQHEEALNEKLQQAQQRAAADHEKVIETFSKKVLELEREIERYKAEEVRVKQEIGEREDEIGRLDSTLNETQETLEESERVRSRLEKEMGNAAGLSKKVMQAHGNIAELLVLFDLRCGETYGTQQLLCFRVGVMYSGEYDACDVTLSVYPHCAGLKNLHHKHHIHLSTLHQHRKIMIIIR
jgi:hypothetical protein